MNLLIQILLFSSAILFIGCANKESTNKRKCDSQPTTSRVETKNSLPDDAIPITLYRNHLYINTELKQEAANLLFDTGAEGLYLDSTFYKSSSLKFDNTITAMVPGVGNKPQKIKLIRDSIQLRVGNYDYTTKGAPLIDLRMITGDYCDGVLGDKIFKEKILEINYQDEYLRVHPAFDSINFRGFRKLNLQEVKGKLYLSANLIVNDQLHIEGMFLVDLGSGGSVTLGSPVAMANKLNEKIKDRSTRHSKYAGIGGKSTSCYFNARALKIGGFSLEGLIANYSLDEKGSLASKERSGIIGTEIWKRFIMIIDYSEKCLYLKPNSNFSKPFKESIVGFSFVDRSESMSSWVVTGIEEGSSAVRAGIKIDDRITHINGTDITKIPLENHANYFDDKENIELDIRRGNEKQKITFTVNNSGKPE